MSESLFEQYKAALRRGHMAALAGELDDALSAYDLAAQLVPERALPHASRGTVLHRLDRWPEAEASFERALQLAPDDEASLRTRAGARSERGLRSGAAADFERLAFVLDVGGRAAAAAEAARRAAELEPTTARAALADRLETAAARLADVMPVKTTEALETGGTEAREGTEADAANAALSPPVGVLPPTAADAVEDPWAAAFDESRLASLDGEGREDLSGADSEGADSEGPDNQGADNEGPDDASVDEATRGSDWPGIDLPSPPPPPMEGPPPDPEDLLAEATLVLERGEVDAARDLMLTAARVHRDGGRIDAALEICLNLLSIAPGDPRVHLAIANLQLDRGWTDVATEKLDLLVRLTSLTGDTQAEADVHGLASERLRDAPEPSTAGS